jgi:Ankyrin repeat
VWAIRSLIDAGANINAADKVSYHTNRPFSLVIRIPNYFFIFTEGRFSHLPVFYPLLSLYTTKNGYTALMIAVQNGYYRTVEALLEMGADIHAVDKVRKTAQ